jgi:hypothetical protein
MDEGGFKLLYLRNQEFKRDENRESQFICASACAHFKLRLMIFPAIT